MEITLEEKAKKQSGRRWVFTYNNPIMTGEQFLEILKGMNHLRYIVFQKEQGEHGTPHFQGYMEFTQPKKRQTLCHRLKAWYMPAMGKPWQCKEYCTKEATRLEDPIEWGTSVTQGQRVDIIGFRDAISEETNARQMIEEYPLLMAKFPKFYRLCSNLTFPHREIAEKQVILCYGPPRSGKTTWARKQTKDYWINPIGSGKWFDGYDKQPTVIFDDYGGDGTVYRLNDLLRLTHTWTETVQIKGAFVPWCPSKVIFTTNYHPSTWYSLEQDDQKRYQNREVSYEALIKRFTKVLYFQDDHLPPTRIGNIEEFFYDPNYLNVYDAFKKKQVTPDFNPYEDEQNTLHSYMEESLLTEVLDDMNL